MIEKHYVSVRLDPSTIARVDALIPHVRTKRRKVTRSDVLRALIVSALERNVLGKSARPLEIDVTTWTRKAPKCAG